MESSARLRGCVPWWRRAPRRALCWTRSKQILLEANSDWLEAVSMDLAGTETGQRREMLGRRITLVAVEAVLRVEEVKRSHLGVARGLGEDRGGRDHGMQRIAVDDGARPAADLGAMLAVDPDFFRSDGERLDRTLHGEQRRPENIEPVALLDARSRDGPGDGAILDAPSEHFASLRSEDLRVCEAVDAPRRVEDHSRGVDRPGQRPAAGLVYSADDQLKHGHGPAP